MKLLIRLELRMEAELPEENHWAACARCGRHNRLVPRRSPNGGIVWLQPNHFCIDAIGELNAPEEI